MKQQQRPKRGWTDELYLNKVHYRASENESLCNGKRTTYEPLAITSDESQVTCEKCQRGLERKNAV